MVFNSYSKINLTLTINSKKKSGLHEIQSYYCLINLNDKIKIIQIIGRNFCNLAMEPLISHHTGFNLSILKTKKGIVKDLIFNTSTIVFSQKGSWKINIDGDEIDLNSKDTFSIPINKKVSISADNKEDCFLNCVSKA